MNFHWHTLYHMQKELDESIISRKNLQGKDLFRNKVAAVILELGELGNELPHVFKFWSTKTSNKQRTLEEYVDVLHFLVSLGVDLQIKDLEITRLDIERFKCEDILSQFMKLFSAIMEFDVMNKKTWFLLVIPIFVGLGELIGFTWEDVVQAYIQKNAVNHERQQSGY